MGWLRYRGRPAPLSNKLISGKLPWYQHTDGLWYDVDTHELVDVQVQTLEECLSEMELENEIKRKASRERNGIK